MLTAWYFSCSHSQNLYKPEIFTDIIWNLVNLYILRYHNFTMLTSVLRNKMGSGRNLCKCGMYSKKVDAPCSLVRRIYPGCQCIWMECSHRCTTWLVSLYIGPFDWRSPLVNTVHMQSIQDVLVFKTLDGMFKQMCGLIGEFRYGSTLKT